MQVSCPSCQAPIPVPIFALGPLEAPVPVLCPRCRSAVELRQGPNGIVTANLAPSQRRPASGAADSFFQGSAAALADTGSTRRAVPQRSRDAEMLREFSVMFKQAATRSWGSTIGLIVLALAAAAGVGFGVWWYMGKQAAVAETDTTLAAVTTLTPDGTATAGSPAMPNASQLGEHLHGVMREARAGNLRPTENVVHVGGAVGAPRDATPTGGSALEPVNRKQLDALCHARTVDMQACSVRFANGAPIQVHFSVNTVGQIDAVRAEVDGARNGELTICVAELLKTNRFGFQPEDVHHQCDVRGLVQAPDKHKEHSWKSHKHAAKP